MNMFTKVGEGGGEGAGAGGTGGVPSSDHNR